MYIKGVNNLARSNIKQLFMIKLLDVFYIYSPLNGLMQRTVLLNVFDEDLIVRGTSGLVLYQTSNGRLAGEGEEAGDGHGVEFLLQQS